MVCWFASDGSRPAAASSAGRSNRLNGLRDYDNVKHGALNDYTLKMIDAVTLPWDSEELSRQLGVDPSRYDHTALGDCEWSRDMLMAMFDGARLTP